MSTVPSFDVFGAEYKAPPPPDAVEDTAIAPSCSKPAQKRQLPADADAADGRETEKKARISEPEFSFAAFQEQRVEELDVEGCVHERCYPPEQTASVEPPPSAAAAEAVEATVAPAKTYPFELDSFQARSIACLEKRESVLVSAHTSAGKTVVAEYAIAMALRDKQRVIYTSPIKALSNQKYRELHEEFADVGLMTGDVTINPSASCLVMTTEILRNMLYRGSEVLRSVAWVVFDEIHYMRDKERGVVWEESMILLPSTVRFVFLSATIPNAREFASWIAKLHNHICNVVYTDKRPTPLQHYIFPQGGDGLYLVVDEKSQFRDSNFQKALSAMNSSNEKQQKQKGKPQAGKKTVSDIYKITKMILERRYDPVIIFSFSKRDCEAHALQMSKLDFTSDDEKKLVQQIFENAIDSLSEEDKRLPQVENILPLLLRGIGIHHGGLLPILKEVIEILFQESLLKVLFATETFSMGLNMPAKTVVFTSAVKFDGSQFRNVTSGEYIQMSGRAGRRGLDDRGIVILMLQDKMEPADAKQMMSGEADSLSSSFHLGYNMLLNLIRVEEADPEYLIERSFYQFQCGRAAPELLRQLHEAEQRRDAIVLGDERAISDYFYVKSQLDVLGRSMREFRNRPLHALPFLNPGRLVLVPPASLHAADAELAAAAAEGGSGGSGSVWAVLLNFKKRFETAGKNGSTGRQVVVDGTDSAYTIDVLVRCGSKKKPDMKAVSLRLEDVDQLSSVRLYLPKKLTALESRRSVLKSVDEVLRRFGNVLPLLDPVEDMKITDAAFRKLLRKIESLEDRLAALPAAKSKQLASEFALFSEKRSLQTTADSLRKQVKAASGTLEFRHKLKCMKRVLRRLGFITADNVVDVKGRVACEISTGDELLLTELIFSGVFNELDPANMAALLSALVFTGKGDESVPQDESLAVPIRALKEHAKRVADVMIESKLDIDKDAYVSKFKTDMMMIVKSWCAGAKFADICKMTSTFEGSVIRCMRRLEELMRQTSSAAKLIGNTELEQKFEKGIELIKRDIVFAASLYL